MGKINAVIYLRVGTEKQLMRGSENNLNMRNVLNNPIYTPVIEQKLWNRLQTLNTKRNA